MAGAINRAFFILLARLVVAGSFVMAALPKIQDPAGFATSVAAFRVLGPELSVWVALLLPWLELVIGIGIVVPAIRRGSASLIALLLITFIGLHASAWARGLDISCGCFGAETGAVSSDYRWLILRNAGLLIVTLLVLKRDLRNKANLGDSQI
jgi:putative oxidoreductase